MSDENVKETVEENANPNAFSVSKDNEKDSRTIELEYEFGSNSEESIEKFGEEVVHGYFLKGIKVGLQAYIRRMMKEDKSDDEILAALDNWTPGVRAPRIGGGSSKRLLEQFAKMTPEKQAELLAKLQEKIG